MRQRVEVTYAVYSAVKPASRPKMRYTPGQLGLQHFARIGARSVQDGAASAIDGAGVFAIQWPDVYGIGYMRGIHVRQTFPSFADADHLTAEFAGAIHYRLDHRIQAWNVAEIGRASCRERV